VLEPGEFRIAVGASSRDIRLAETIVVAGSPRALPLTASSTLTEWLAGPAGGPALRAAFGTGPDGTPGGILSSDELVRALGDFPLPVLAVFGVGITHEQVSELLAAIPAPPGESAWGLRPCRTRISVGKGLDGVAEPPGRLLDPGAGPSALGAGTSGGSAMRQARYF